MMEKKMDTYYNRLYHRGHIWVQACSFGHLFKSQDGIRDCHFEIVSQ